MNIDIVSNDQRYAYLNELLLKDGYSSKISTPKSLTKTDILILSIRNELSDNELEEIFSRVDKDTQVFCGNGQRIEKYFQGEIIDYSKNEELILKNARLTAEATVSIFHTITKTSPKNKKIFICGYGRIGKELSKIFSCLGAEIFVYARREIVREEVVRDGYYFAPPELAPSCDVIINTAPSIVFSNSLIEKIPRESTIIELASVCGFENEERVNFALGLPGRIMPKSSAQVIYDAIVPLFK